VLKLGNGDGTFRSALNVPVGSAPSSVTVADVNGDGHPDLVVTNIISNTVSVLLGNGDGSFRSSLNFPIFAPTFVAVGDVNGDGRPDLIVGVSSQDSNIGVLLGNGDGTFQAARLFRAGTEPYSVALADLNGDGHPDMIVANSFSNNVSVLLGNGDGTFQNAENFSAGVRPDSLAVIDLNGDGEADIVTANGLGNNVSVLIHISHAATHLEIDAPSTARAGTSFNVTVTALNAANLVDCLYTGTVTIGSNTDGQFVPPPPYTFTAADAGIRTFQVTLKTAGFQSLLASDGKGHDNLSRTIRP
jgi:hypothetical protein